MENLSFYLVADPHYYDSSFKRSGRAYEERSKTDQKCVAETPAIIDACFAKLAADTETDIILIPGDLVYRGEYQSQAGFRERLYKLREAGKKIYLITARHDYGEKPCEFDGDEMLPVKGMERGELRDFYRDFGFDSAVSEHRESMSYVAQLGEGVRLLALNCDGDCADFRGFWENQMQWALGQIEKAHREGQYIFAMTHYPILPFSPIMNVIDDAKITDWQSTAEKFADAGLDLIFTGHMHAQAVTDYTSKSGNKLTEVQTACVVGCPCAYRKINLKDGRADIESFTVEDFDYDKGGRTAEEYFRWRFDRMIGLQMESVLPGIVKKILAKLTLKRVGRLLFFKVDEKIADMLLTELATELVRNIFIGNEPHVAGTPVYEAIKMFLKRVRPILRVAEKKLGAKQPIFADIEGFVLSTIGDEKQRDYTCTLELNGGNFNAD